MSPRTGARRTTLLAGQLAELLAPTAGESHRAERASRPHQGPGCSGVERRPGRSDAAAARPGRKPPPPAGAASPRPRGWHPPCPSHLNPSPTRREAPGLGPRACGRQIPLRAASDPSLPALSPPRPPLLSHAGGSAGLPPTPAPPGRLRAEEEAGPSNRLAGLPGASLECSCLAGEKQVLSGSLDSAPHPGSGRHSLAEKSERPADLQEAKDLRYNTTASESVPSDSPRSNHGRND
ncbi:proline-rich protein HaeIII subfamily 1-like [Nycticebus coucang]|uniref:proline-rich protein HaeIII subfamily 1-like n=1 Tax=Nycticebus coucang TaxID=9470 RepID=UPI00234CEC87|nr:proline-rich protein HaeIII subfamily 1-like [Nycticebus coucang]